MANNGHLITKETAKEMGRKGGIQHGINLRKRKSMQTMLNDVLSRKVKDKETRDMLAQYGFKASEMTNQATLLYAMIQETIRGNVKAFEALMKVLGELPITDTDYVIECESTTHEETIKALSERSIDGVDDAIQVQ